VITRSGGPGRGVQTSIASHILKLPVVTWMHQIKDVASNHLHLMPYEAKQFLKNDGQWWHRHKKYNNRLA